VTDLRQRAPAQAVMEKLVSLRGTPDLVEWPLGIVRLSKDGESWLRGVKGELSMAHGLSTLGREWTVLHSIPVGLRGSDIDHIAIGPTGVFPINSKRLLDRRIWVAGGRFLVDGRHREYLRYADFEAARVEAVLRAAGIQLTVMPVIAISGAKKITIRSNPMWNGRNIGVADSQHVARRIRRRSPKLTHDQVEQIVTLFSDPAAWTRKPLPTDDAPAIRAAYDRIERGVRRWNAFIVLTGLLGTAAAVGIAELVIHALRF
jgi:hypothetical protein